MTIKEKLILDLSQALRGLSKLSDGLMKIGKSFGVLKTTTKEGQQSISLDMSKIAQSFALLGAVAGGAMAAIITNSPTLSASIAEITFQFNILSMQIGEALAPVLTPLLDMLSNLISYFQSLPTPLKAFIGLTIALTAAISALGVAVVVLSSVSLPLIGAILAISAAIAAVIVASMWIIDMWDKWGTMTKILVSVLLIILGPLGWIVLAIVAVYETIQHWGEIVNWFGDLWDGFTNAVVSAWQWVGDQVSKIWDGLVNSIVTGFKWAGDQISKIWGLITGMFEQTGGFLSSLLEDGFSVFKGAINSLGNWINSNIIAPLNNTLKALKDFEIKGWHPFGAIQMLPDIPQFAQGALNIPQDMMSIVHKGEMIIPRPFAQDLRQVGGFGGPNVTINLSIDSPVIRNDNDIDQLVREVEGRVSKSIVDKLQRGSSWV